MKDPYWSNLKDEIIITIGLIAVSFAIMVAIYLAIFIAAFIASKLLF